jgi:hypothetical protein
MAEPKPFRTADRDDKGPVLTPEESRQGVISGRVRMILATSLVLALIAFFVVYSLEIV